MLYMYIYCIYTLLHTFCAHFPHESIVSGSWLKNEEHARGTLHVFAKKRWNKETIRNMLKKDLKSVNILEKTSQDSGFSRFSRFSNVLPLIRFPSVFDQPRFQMFPEPVGARWLTLTSRTRLRYRWWRNRCGAPATRLSCCRQNVSGKMDQQKHVISFCANSTILYIYIYYIEHCEESCECPNHHTLKRFRGLTSSMLVSFLSLGLKRRQVGCRVPKNVARFQGLFRELAGAVRCSGNQDKTDARSA